MGGDQPVVIVAGPGWPAPPTPSPARRACCWVTTGWSARTPRRSPAPIRWPPRPTRLWSPSSPNPRTAPWSSSGWMASAPRSWPSCAGPARGRRPHPRHRRRGHCLHPDVTPGEANRGVTAVLLPGALTGRRGRAGRPGRSSPRARRHGRRAAGRPRRCTVTLLVPGAPRTPGRRGGPCARGETRTATTARAAVMRAAVDWDRLGVPDAPPTPLLARLALAYARDLDDDPGAVPGVDDLGRAVESLDHRAPPPRRGCPLLRRLRLAEGVHHVPDRRLTAAADALGRSRLDPARPSRRGRRVTSSTPAGPAPRRAPRGCSRWRGGSTTWPPGLLRPPPDRAAPGSTTPDEHYPLGVASLQAGRAAEARSLVRGVLDVHRRRILTGAAGPRGVLAGPRPRRRTRTAPAPPRARRPRRAARATPRTRAPPGGARARRGPLRRPARRACGRPSRPRARPATPPGRPRPASTSPTSTGIAAGPRGAGRLRPGHRARRRGRPERAGGVARAWRRWTPTRRRRRRAGPDPGAAPGRGDASGTCPRPAGDVPPERHPGRGRRVDPARRSEEALRPGAAGRRRPTARRGHVGRAGRHGSGAKPNPQQPLAGARRREQRVLGPPGQAGDVGRVEGGELVEHPLRPGPRGAAVDRHPAARRSAPGPEGRQCVLRQGPRGRRRGRPCRGGRAGPRRCARSPGSRPGRAGWGRSPRRERGAPAAVPGRATRARTTIASAASTTVVMTIPMTRPLLRRPPWPPPDVTGSRGRDRPVTRP